MMVISVAETCSCKYCYIDELSVVSIGSDKFLSGGRNKSDF